MPAYLLREGEGKAIAIYSRCEDELLCRAELLVMLGEVDARVPPGLARGPIHGYYDVDSTCTREEFLSSYEKDPAKHEKLVEAKRAITEDGWDFPALD